MATEACPQLEYLEADESIELAYAAAHVHFFEERGRYPTIGDRHAEPFQRFREYTRRCSGHDMLVPLVEFGLDRRNSTHRLADDCAVCDRRRWKDEASTRREATSPDEQEYLAELVKFKEEHGGHPIADEGINEEFAPWCSIDRRCAGGHMMPLIFFELLNSSQLDDYCIGCRYQLEGDTV